ncbi:hypothetical protein PPERSA_01086 [Pseudocohnilembus persalinus]|uniref:Potassium channel domain-containing protein n=1 Tax=Pseudocohnilembus persalinus TaxID=266149 RepID=A0A0V0QVP5_PSEPJ|nr:hypothetical protein PPERSA_01086 [Pseudocohnilembus persalinus]|eukprot:KRX06008.1 hypothetical protein PPERSA_01086 [Pseudocohnilembus persalinus]
MITVGYGDIAPVTLEEKLYVIFITMVTCAGFGYAANKVSDIFKTIQQRKDAVKKEKFLLLQYLEHKEIDKSLKNQVLRYLEFAHLVEQEEYFNMGRLLLEQKISKDLKNMVRKNLWTWRGHFELWQRLEIGIFIKRLS